MAPRKGTKKKASSGSRRSRAESMTVAKEAAVEVRTIGDNSQLAIPAPDDWSHHKKAIAGWREKVTTAQGGLRNAIKQAKKSGVNMKALDMVVGIERENDPVKALNFFQQLDMGLSLSDETTIRITPHDTLAGDQEDLVAKRGYEDGKAGRTPNNQYPENSTLADLYMSNWQKGQAELLGVDVSEDEFVN